MEFLKQADYTGYVIAKLSKYDMIGTLPIIRFYRGTFSVEFLIKAFL